MTSDLLTRAVEAAARGVASELELAKKERIYRDRNLAALSLAVDRQRLGGDAGWYHSEDEETDYPVVWAVLPTGQVSWHVTPDFLDVLDESILPERTPPGGYDGHDRELKNERLAYHIDGVDTRVTEG